MQFEKNKYKVACIIGIITSSICLLIGIISTIYTIDLASFKEYFNTYIDSLGADSEMMQMIYESGMDLNDLGRISYVVTIILSCSSLTCFVLCLIFSLITLKDYALDAKAFQKRNGLHVWFVISIALCWLSSDTADLSFISSMLDLSFFISIALWIAFFMAINDMRLNKRVEYRINARGDVHERPYYTQGDYVKNDEPKPADYSIDNQQKEIHVEERPAPTVEETNKNNEDMYELLAKLEKRYKAGELSEEDYRRMKKTILDNYLN